MHRRIRKLRLTCIRESDARHGRVLLEDALRTASLGDESRLILVRRLDLGPLSSRATATHWSRRVEQAFREARPVAVRFDSPEAARANAVYFANQHEPWLTLAERVAAGQPCREWYWRAAVAGWSPALSVGETLRRCFRKMAERGGLALTLVLGLRLHTQGVLPALLRTLQAADVDALQPELGSPAASQSGPSPPAPSPAPGWATEADFGRHWGAGDLRTRWLAALVIARASHPTGEPSLAPSLSAVVLPGLVRQVVLQWTEPHGEPTPSRPPMPVAAVSLPAPSPPAVATPDRGFTRAGGLFFVIPLLGRAGFSRHLQTLPDGPRASLPWQVLQLCLRHVRVAPGDCLARALANIPPSGEPIARWVLAAHRHARDLTGLTLREVILRPALVALSPTQVDVLFRPEDAEIRIRGAGLDFDPGWVPWLRRVIAYHYTREA